ncbi:hypothetical protein [Roseateles amylovorans]|uniref:Inner membrane transmembrane protein n=1 Tax=Roseateles amylovorans TaxID=2978473 RepID=A0ABY6AVL9_9BURK|nr:hypothetical protein [Roseateles amylovorans]UXH76434.1 hypothetical protein N4261_15360 [Roseateles amylovorans]
MNLPTPAVVAERSAHPIPRWALLLLCAAYVLPGLFGRDPWRNADLTAFGYMASIAQGHAPWLQPAIAGLPAEGGLLPYWIGGLFIKLLPFLEPSLAARIPFGLMLAAVLALVWYSCLHLARTEAAQPVAFAFGGEAHAVDYARAMADGSLLALIASLGLLRLGHETTPEILQLLGITLFVYGLAAVPFRRWKSRLALLLSLTVLATSGAPAVALALAVGALWLTHRSVYDEARQLLPWLLGAMVLATLAAWPMHGWAWRIHANGRSPLEWLRLVGWFCWPAWPLALWSMWRWRAHLQRRHLSVPALAAAVPLLCSLLMNADERALLLALPPLAVLASFALPTFQRSASALLDWFSVFFFSAGAIFLWLYYSALQLGWPAKFLANVRRLAQGYEPDFGWLTFVLATLGTLAWIWLVRWRTTRHRHAIWKSLALPAGGVALAWLLAMTLGLHPLNYARSNKPLVERIGARLPAEVDCIAAPGLPLHVLAALEFQGGWTVQATQPLDRSACSFGLISQGDAAAAPPAGWQAVAVVRRPTERTGSYVVLHRLR